MPLNLGRLWWLAEWGGETSLSYSTELATLALPETRDALHYLCLQRNVAFRRLAISISFLHEVLRSTALIPA